jgi:hypothetical protein
LDRMFLWGGASLLLQYSFRRIFVGLALKLWEYHLRSLCCWRDQRTWSIWGQQAIRRFDLIAWWFNSIFLRLTVLGWQGCPRGAQAALVQKRRLGSCLCQWSRK